MRAFKIVDTRVYYVLGQDPTVALENITNNRGREAPQSRDVALVDTWNLDDPPRKAAEA